MRFDIITVLPELLESPLNHSIMKRAQSKGHLELHVHGLRDYGLGRAKSVDDYPFGGGAGMVLMCEPISNLIEKLQKEVVFDEIIFLTPDGKTFDQPTANRLSMRKNLLLICGHYKGIDQRLRDKYVTMELSIGDYVLSGGELAACVVVDAIGRLLPGVLNDETSALFDSFQDHLLAPPVFTRPAVWDGRPIPDILLSGHEAKIEAWRLDQAIERTRERRPDLYEKWGGDED